MAGRSGFSVSIPEGAIEGFGRDFGRNFWPRFQYPKVRLKGLGNGIEAEKWTQFQYPKVRLKVGHWQNILSNKNVSIPEGAIEGELKHSKRFWGGKSFNTRRCD